MYRLTVKAEDLEEGAEYNEAVAFSNPLEGYGALIMVLDGAFEKFGILTPQKETINTTKPNPDHDNTGGS